jgi:hypothetical protein
MMKLCVCGVSWVSTSGSIGRGVVGVITIAATTTERPRRDRETSVSDEIKEHPQEQVHQ